MSANATAIISAFIAGGFLAATGVLQQRAAGRRPKSESLSPRLLWSLLHDRLWLAGIGTGFVSYGCQALALAYGPLALVQPIFLSELLFAVPISVLLNHMRMRGRDWAGLLAVAGGLALAILFARPRVGNPLPPMKDWALAAGVISGTAAVAVLVGRRLSGPAQSSLYAVAGAAVLAIQSALLASVVALVKRGLGPLFGGWQSYAMIPATAIGVMLVMSAYQAGPLAASMPVIDASEPTFAVVIGLAVFGEKVHHTSTDLVGIGAGLVLFLGGIVLLDTSQLVQALHRQQEEGGRTTASSAKRR